MLQDLFKSWIIEAHGICNFEQAVLYVQWNDNTVDGPMHRVLAAYVTLVKTVSDPYGSQ